MISWGLPKASTQAGNKTFKYGNRETSRSEYFFPQIPLIKTAANIYQRIPKVVVVVSRGGCFKFKFEYEIVFSPKKMLLLLKAESNSLKNARLILMPKKVMFQAN